MYPLVYSLLAFISSTLVTYPPNHFYHSNFYHTINCSLSLFVRNANILVSLVRLFSFFWDMNSGFGLEHLIEGAFAHGVFATCYHFLNFLMPPFSPNVDLELFYEPSYRATHMSLHFRNYCFV